MAEHRKILPLITPEFPKNIIQEKPQLRLLYYQTYILYIMTQIKETFLKCIATHTYEI